MNCSKRLKPARVDALHIVKKLLELCEVTLSDVFIQNINERLVFLIKLGRLPHGVDKLLYLRCASP